MASLTESNIAENILVVKFVAHFERFLHGFNFQGNYKFFVRKKNTNKIDTLTKLSADGHMFHVDVVAEAALVDIDTEAGIQFEA